MEVLFLRKWIKRFVFALLTIIIGCFVYWYIYLHSKINLAKPVTVNIVSGESFSALTRQLQQKNIIQHPLLWLMYAKVTGNTRQIQAGSYEIVPSSTPVTILEQFVKGKVILHRISFIAGWTFVDVIHAIKNSPYLQHTLQGKSSAQIMAALGHPRQDPEGEFYPDTYLFGAGTKDIKILRQAYQKMQRILSSTWQQKASGLPYTHPYQALIMASIIEKETNLPEEKPLVAGVLVRRLRKNMLLQVDPTVIYALGASFTGSLSTQDLKIKSPYNTYIHKGLPPTPIALPDKASLVAALHPAKGKTLYYVATGDGGHVFSVTFAAHRKAVAAYLTRKSVWQVKNRAVLHSVLRRLMESGLTSDRWKVAKRNLMVMNMKICQWTKADDK